jgi:hypothetical protein
MILFIACCALLAFLVQSHNPYVLLLTTPIGLGISLAIMCISLIIGYLKKVPSIIWHDSFASSSLLLWYGYWQPQFDENAPMFIFYPIYFALFTSIVTLALINKSQRFDLESIQYLRQLDKIVRYDMSVAILFVLISIAITRHYALYMIAMTFFIVRHTLIVCLEEIDHK